MKLDTKRLIIIPLTYNQLTKYIQVDGSLEKELEVNFFPRNVPPELADAFIKTIFPAVANEKNNYFFSTLWTIILKKKNVMAGDLCFKGAPNEKGEIEIGYGTYDLFKGNGYMTEAILAIAKWAFEQQDICAIVAETDSSNIPSHRVLEKSGFKKYLYIENMIWWRLDKN